MSDTISALDVLKEARSLVEHGWTTKAFARDDRGYPVKATEGKPVLYCMLGAVERVIDGKALEDERSNPYDCLQQSANRIDPASVADHWLDGFNDADDRTHEEVLEAFDIAIDICEKELSEGESN